jgi:hypothetical protein
MEQEVVAQVDLIGPGLAKGLVANQLKNDGKLNVGLMRPWISDKNNKTYVTVYTGGDPTSRKNYQTYAINVNGTLRRDEWKQLDQALLDVSRQRLGGIQDLIDAGLTFNLGSAMGTTVLEWHDVSDALEAEMTMDGITRAKNDQLNFQTNYLPLPIIHADYEINSRLLASSRNMGNPLDTTLAERAARKVNEKLEKLLFTDVTYAFGQKDDRSRNKIYSYLNHPDRNQVSMGTHWDDFDFDSTSAAGPDKILEDVADMKQTSINNYHYGPWTIYIPTAYETIIDKDYSKESGKTIRERIMQIDGIKKIKVIDTLPANNVVMVQMTSDVVRLVRGLGVQNVEWKSEGNMVTNYKVMTIQVPQIRSDQNGKSGIVHLA